MSLKSIVFASSLALALSGAPVLFAQDSVPQQAESDRIDKLMARLAGSNDFDDREDATEALIKEGKAIAPRLQKLHDATKDAEVKARTRFILDRLGKAPVESEGAPADPRKSEPRESGPRIVPLPGMEEMMKELQLPEAFKKMLEGLQKEIEREFQGAPDKDSAPAPGKPRVRTFTWSNLPQGNRPRRVRMHDSGISADRPAAALRSHLGLGLKDGGIVIAAIAPGSYAEHVGLKMHDVILKVKGTTVTSLADMEALRAGGGEIEIIRKGARTTIAAPKLLGKPQRPVKKPSVEPKKRDKKEELPKDF